MLNKSILYLLLFSVFPFFIVGCENQQINLVSEEVEEVELDFSNFSLEGIEFGLTDKDGYFTTSIDLDEYNIEDVLSELSEELFSEDDISENEYHELITIYNVEKNILTVKSKIDNLPEAEMKEERTTYSNNKCGEGEGWRYFETCRSESCVRAAMEITMSYFVDDLIIGGCIETRTLRTLTGVVICGRVKNNCKN